MSHPEDVDILPSDTFRGNSVQHWYDKARAYGAIVHGCGPALAVAGFPVEPTGDRTTAIADAVEALVLHHTATSDDDDLTADEWHVVWRHRVDGLPRLAKAAMEASNTDDCDAALKALLQETQRAEDALHAKGTARDGG